MDVELVKKEIDRWKWLRDVPGYLIFLNKRKVIGKVIVEGNGYVIPSQRKTQWDFYVYEDEPFGEKYQFKFLIEVKYDSKTWTKTKERLLVCVLKKTLINALMEANHGCGIGQKIY